MSIDKLLIANRGEISIRIAAAAADLGVKSLAVYSEDDASALHRYKSDDSAPLKGIGPAAYLDGAQLVRLAEENGCDAVHPGYGFLSENADFVRQCAAAGLTFVGPTAEVLDLFANKAKARAAAQKIGAPVNPGSDGQVDLEGAKAFFASLSDGAAMVIKAVAGGGGRGMRIVSDAEDIAEAFAACQSEGLQAFGDDRVLVEKFMRRARHVEIQVVADKAGGVIHLGERECSLQRRNQKIIEIAPCPDLSPRLRAKIADCAVRLAESAGYENIGTFEFLVDGEEMRARPDEAGFAFLEVNPRLQVEHTVTEELMSVDLVQTQLRIAAGETLGDLGLRQENYVSCEGFALQARVNMEVMDPDGRTRPTAGAALSAYETSSGPYVRVDGYGYAGYETNPRYDSLLAKVIVRSPQNDFASLLAKARRALSECRIEGVETNIPFLQALMKREEVAGQRFYTRFVDDHIEALAASASESAARLYPESGVQGGRKEDRRTTLSEADVPPGAVVVAAPMQGMISELNTAPGASVSKGQTLAVMEAMKMVHHINAPVSGVVRHCVAAVGEVVYDSDGLFVLEPAAIDGDERASTDAEIDLDHIRPDLEQILERRRLGRDEARPEAVAKRRKTHQRTARENVADLCDEDSFVEYGGLAMAAQRLRRSTDDLIRNTPGDGMVAGVGSINGARFGEKESQCVVVSYDYTVLAGTQGHQNHRKKDRMFELAERRRLPVVLLAEGGGGRPGDTDVLVVAGLELTSFSLMAKLSGLVPLVGVVSGRCFAGNAALLGCCDVIIATENASIGMGGPAMIEGGGLGVCKPEEVGPMSVQVPNGVVDIAVNDEAEAVAVAKKYLSYFQGATADWTAADQRLLRRSIPEDRVRIYDIRKVIETLVDTDSFLELRKAYGQGIITGLARIEGRPIGLMANNPMHLGGAIDGPAADKASRFMQLCDAHDIPMVSLCDTPGFMVGPESEKTAVVRRFARLFVTAASMTTPFFTIVLRKAYGLGAMSMLAGNARAPDFTVSWPSGEFGGMGLEGAIKLGFRKEIEAIADPEEREAFYRQKVAEAYEFGKAANAAAHFEIDDVIDPIESRRWIIAGLKSAPTTYPRTSKKRNHIDTW
ncbi:MAG: carboxyl transferase domain-containing protein [Pseudomonadota bacterium]